MAPRHSGSGRKGKQNGRSNQGKGRPRRETGRPNRDDDRSGRDEGRSTRDGGQSSEGRGGHGGGRKRRKRRRERVRGEDGQFVEKADQQAVLGVFDAVAGPVVTTTDVSDVLGVSTESARQKLNELVEQGDLRRRKTGRTVVYWQVE